MNLAAAPKAIHAAKTRARLDLSTPMLPIAVGFVCGIVLDTSWAAGTTLYVATLAASGLGLLMPLKWRRQRQVLVLLASTATGAFLHKSEFRHLPTNHIARYTADEPIFVELQGQIVQSPKVSRPAANELLPAYRRQEKTSFVLDVHTVRSAHGQHAIRGLVRVTVSAPRTDLAAGDQVNVFGKLFRPSPPQNPGQFDWALFLRRRGIYAGLSCEFTESVTKVESPQGGWLTHWLNRVRVRVRQQLHEGLPSDERDKRSLLDAMVIGQQSQLEADVRDAFRVTGTAHFLALSGLHVGMLAMFVWFVSRCLNLSRQWGAAAVVIVVLCYLLIVEPRPSVLRAAIIVTVFCVGILIKRPVNSLNNVCLAAAIVLAFDPLQLFGAGFQMSFAVTLGILYLTPALSSPMLQHRHAKQLAVGGAGLPRKQPGHWSKRLTRLLVRVIYLTLAVSLAAWLIGSPLVAYHFNKFYVLGCPFSALLMPLVFVMMFTAFVKLLLGGLWSATAAVLGPALGWASGLLLWVIDSCARLPVAAVDVPTPSLAWLGLYYTGLLLWVVSRGLTHAYKRRCEMVCAGIAIVLGASTCTALMIRGVTNELRVTTLAVGAGTATIVELPDGRICLYDAGSTSNYDVGKFVIVPALRALGIRRIAAVIISHANYDHYSGLPAVAEAFPIQQVVITPQFQRSSAAGTLQRDLLQRLKDSGVSLMHLASDSTNTLTIPAVTTEVLWPPTDLINSTAANDRSLVLRLTYAGQRILFTGDIDREAEEQLLSSGLDLQADVLMLPHHGSVNPATSRFLDAVNPRIVVCSSGRKKTVPASRIEELTRDYVFLNTADVGAISITLGKQGLKVSTHDPSAAPPASENVQ